MCSKAIRVLLLVTVVLGVAACGPTPEPQVIEKVVTKEVEKQVVVTKEVEKEVVVTKEVEKQVVVTKEVEKEVVITATPEPKEEQVVVYGTTLGMDTFDPCFVGYAPNFGMTKTVFEGLVEHNETMGITPKLAESWELSEDGATWTFHLRKGVMFHDGTPLNAEAVVYSWERLMNPDVGCKDSARLVGVVAKMEVIDDLTLAVTTTKPFPEFLTNLTDRNTSVISPTAAEKYSPMDFGHMEPAGTGPFKFDKWVGTDRIEVVANPDYWGPQPQVDRLVFRIIPEAASLVAAVEAGEVDVADPLNPDDAIRLQDDPDLFVGKYDAFVTIMNGILMTVPPLDDVRVRQALNYMLDKEAIADGIFLGYAKPTVTVLFPGLPYRVPQPPYTYNPEKARELLAEAGYPDGFTTELAYSPDFDKGREVSEAIAAYAADVGITLDLVPMESAVLSSYYREKEEVPGRRIFMIRKSAFGVDFNLTRLFSKASWDDDNRSRFYDAEVERLLEEARYSFDEGVRSRNYAEVQRIVWEAAPEQFLYTYSPPYVTQANVKGVWYKPDGTIMLSGVYR